MTCSTAGGRPSALPAGMVSFCRLVICLVTDAFMPEPDSTPAARLGSDATPDSLARPDGATIAYHRLPGKRPGVIFLGGFRSDMTGTKALYLEDYCRRARARLCALRLFRPRRVISGDFASGTIGRWRDDAVAVIDSLTEGQQILVGSSMSGWIMLLAALARPERVAGLVGIAGGARFHRGAAAGPGSPRRSGARSTSSGRSSCPPNSTRPGICIRAR